MALATTISCYLIAMFSLVASITSAVPSPSSPNYWNDTHRPQLHFSPKANWINDPNGMVYLDGEYHLFFQYNPNDIVWGPMHWGHAISTDLVHWEELPIALYPDELGTIYSGSAVVDYRNTSGLQTGTVPPIIAIFTHAGTTQQQSIAVSNDRGRSFQKYAGNPVIPNTNIPDFRDPKVLEVNGEWVMVLAVGQTIDFYSSKDLKTWEKLSEFTERPHGGVWECPDFFQLSDIWVLLASAGGGGPNLGSGTQYFLGEFNGKNFTKFDTNNTILWMDWGPDNYAGVTFSNQPDKKVILMGWMNNLMYSNNLPTTPWRGQMTLPRIFDLKEIDGKTRLVSTPVPGLTLLRRPDQFYSKNQPMDILNGTVFDLSAEIPFRNSLLEVDVEFDTYLVTPDPSAYFQLCFFNNRQEEVCVGYNYGANEIYLDRVRSGNTGFNPEFGRRAAAKRETMTNRILKLKIYLDLSSIEIFADDGFTVMTGLFYPQEPLQGINLVFTSDASGNKVVLLSATVRGLNSIHGNF